MGSVIKILGAGVGVYIYCMYLLYKVECLIVFISIFLFLFLYYFERNKRELLTSLWPVDSFIHVYSFDKFICRFKFISITVELQWLEHFWNHENMFETGVVRAYECES